MIQGIIEILTEDTGVQNVVGKSKLGSEVYKVYTVRAPQNELSPYITVFKLPGTPTQAKNETSSLDVCRFRVFGYVTNYKDRDAITEAIRAALDAKKSVTNNGITFLSIWYETDSDGFDDSAQQYVAIVDFGCEVKR